MLGLFFVLGVFLLGGLVVLIMLFLNQCSGFKEDVIIGLIFIGFFGLGLFMVLLNLMVVSVQMIIMGNIFVIMFVDML